MFFSKVTQSNLSRKNISIKTNTGDYHEFPVQFNDNSFYAELGPFGTYTEILKTEGNIIIGDICLCVSTDIPFIVYCPIEISKPAEKPYFQIPGFLYGTNNLAGSDGKQPRFDYEGEINWPVSSKFYTRADRSTHNCIICIQNNEGFSVGIEEKINTIEYNPSDEWEAKYAYNGLMLDTSKQNNNIIGFTLGYEHFPKRYTWVWDDPVTPNIDEHLHGFIYGQKGNTISTKAYYCYSQASEGIPAYGKLLRSMYSVLHNPPKVRATRKEAMELCTDALISNGWNSKHSFFFLSDNSDEGRNRGNSGWTGGMQVAYPVLKAGVTLQKKQYIDISIQYMNNLCTNGINHNAQLVFEEFKDGQWCVDGWWGQREDCFNWGDQPLHSAYVNGQVAYYLLKSFLLTNETNSKWFSTAQMICKTAIESQRADGAIARFYNPNTGKACDYEGFQSCWFVPAIILLYGITKDETLLQIAEKAIEYYYTFHTKGELYGTPMDTHDAVDQEGNLAFIIACTEMHKITKQAKYIHYLQTAFDYEFSWKFPYNTSFSNEPLRSMEWCSCGGSITSTHNPHIHPMGNLVAGELYYLLQHIKDTYYADRLKDTCIWGLSTFNSPQCNFGFGELGYETEQFFYTDALLLPWWKKWDGGIWESYLPWASGCVILNAAEDIPDEFFI